MPKTLFDFSTIPTKKGSALLLDIVVEVHESRDKHGDFTGAHEGYAVILEEVDELWTEVKKKERDFDKMKKECIQIAAMAIKFYEDICESENRR